MAATRTPTQRAHDGAVIVRLYVERKPQAQIAALLAEQTGRSVSQQTVSRDLEAARRVAPGGPGLHRPSDGGGAGPAPQDRGALLGGVPPLLRDGFCPHRRDGRAGVRRGDRRRASSTAARTTTRTASRASSRCVGYSVTCGSSNGVTAFSCPPCFVANGASP